MASANVAGIDGVLFLHHFTDTWILDILFYKGGNNAH